MKLISVIIPVYNAEKFLKQCLDSVLGQTYENIEVIVVNDGSLDGSLTILKSYAKKDNRIHIVDQENQGVAVARNVGLANAGGDYILFVDADDWVESDIAENLLTLLEETPDADIAVCASDSAESSADIIRSMGYDVEVWDSARQKREFLTHQRLQGMLWNKLIRATLFSGLAFDTSVGYGEDAQVMWKVLACCRNMVMTNQVLYHHIIDPGSISNRRFSSRKYSAVEVWREIEADVRETHLDLLTLATERLAFYATYTLYEMFRSRYIDAAAEADFLNIIRPRLVQLVKATSISLKTKVFAIGVVASPKLVRRFIEKRD